MVLGSVLTKRVLVLTSAVFAELYVSISLVPLFHHGKRHTGLARLRNVDHFDDWGFVDVYVCRVVVMLVMDDFCVGSIFPVVLGTSLLRFVAGR
ncbi:hypothetical protein GGS24DRAFT_168142 [Hypoxylon argillaceum]|nr:hypothetical protein GGS24DRAFT_168142 [Hypoxylon argillaceum]